MGLHFVTPLAALVAVGAALPLLGTALRERKSERTRAVLGLSAPRPLLRVETVLYSVAAIAALAVAAAQPTLHRSRAVLVRTDSQAYFLFDTSRSMLARPAATAPSRFERAIAAGLRMRWRLGGVSVGVGSLTDRPLPHLLPSPNVQAFSRVVQKALAVGTPPPEQRARRATDFGGLVDIADSAWFTPGTKRRLVVLFTDGESRRYSPTALLHSLAAAHMRLIVVRVWRPAEAIYLPNGARDPRYRPDPSAEGLTGLEVFGEHRLGAATRAARSIVDRGPKVEADRVQRTLPLGRYAVLAAAFPIALLLFRRR